MKISVHNLAAYLLEELGSCPRFRLHKYLYYCQAWHLVWYDEAIFKEQIMAWALGPVLPSIYKYHQHSFNDLQKWYWGDKSRLSVDHQETADKILDFYTHFEGRELDTVCRQEDPWRLAREGLDISDRGKRRITLNSMKDYYSRL